MNVRLFAYGFRSQFFLAGAAALVMVPLWASSFVLGTPLGSRWPPTLWHGHEMLFGFIASAVAGFLLTSVPSWTGQKGFGGRPLVILASLWLAGRLMILTSALWPPILTALVDLSFVPAVAALIIGPLLRARNRNTPLLGVLAVFWFTDVVFYIGLLSSNAPLALHSLHIGIDIVLVLVTVIGGRIVPAFTASALRPQGLSELVQNRSWITGLTIAAMIGVTLADAFSPDSGLSGAIAAVAAGLHAVRLVQWRVWRTLRQPIVWVLHVSYAWLPVGLALKAIALLSGAAIAAFWLHALTIGALTTMILAVMTRASLGHTGRTLVVDPLITLAYGMLTVAALIRVFGLAGLGMSYPAVITLTALAWMTAFALFMGVYSPILWGPRIDGKPG